MSASAPSDSRSKRTADQPARATLFPRRSPTFVRTNSDLRPTCDLLTQQARTPTRRGVSNDTPGRRNAIFLVSTQQNPEAMSGGHAKDRALLPSEPRCVRTHRRHLAIGHSPRLCRMRGEPRGDGPRRSAHRSVGSASGAAANTLGRSLRPRHRRHLRLGRLRRQRRVHGPERPVLHAALRRRANRASRPAIGIYVRAGADDSDVYNELDGENGKWGYATLAPFVKGTARCAGGTRSGWGCTSDAGCPGSTCAYNPVAARRVSRGGRLAGSDRPG